MNKHLIHVMLMAAALVMMTIAGIELSVGVVVLVVTCGLLLEGGLRLIHKRDAAKESEALVP